MNASPIEVVQKAYQAFGQGQLDAIMALVDEQPDWTFHGAKGLPYTGVFKTKTEIRRWFESIPSVDDIQAFEPREFFPGGEHVTVLGSERTIARPSGKQFEADWVHVFTVRNGRIVRFWGMYDTAASQAARD